MAAATEPRSKKPLVSGKATCVRTCTCVLAVVTGGALDAAGLQEELKAAQKEVGALQRALATARVASLASEAEAQPNGARLLAASVEGLDAKSLQASCMQWNCLPACVRDGTLYRSQGVSVMSHICCIAVCCSCRMANVESSSNLT